MDSKERKKRVEKLVNDFGMSLEKTNESVPPINPAYSGVTSKQLFSSLSESSRNKSGI